MYVYIYINHINIYIYIHIHICCDEIPFNHRFIVYILSAKLN